MGCASGSSGNKHLNRLRLSTTSGVLSITIVSAHLTHEASMFKMDPYIKVKVTNQEKKTAVAKKGDKQPEFNETFRFLINSCYQIHGRQLELNVMDKQKIGSDGHIGYGIVDFDPVIKAKKARQQLRCFISYERKPAGFVNLIAEFREQNPTTISLRFLTIEMKKKNKNYMDCKIKVEIGEEVLQTTNKTDTKEKYPTWYDEVLTFYLIPSIQECEVTLYDDKDVVGSLKVSPQKMLSHQNSKEEVTENLINEKNEEVATIKFHLTVGENPVFPEISLQKITQMILKQKTEVEKETQEELMKMEKKQQKPKQQSAELKDVKNEIKQSQEKKESQQKQGNIVEKLQQNPT